MHFAEIAGVHDMVEKSFRVRVGVAIGPQSVLRERPESGAAVDAMGLIEQMYAAAEEPSRWDAVLERVARATGARDLAFAGFGGDLRLPDGGAESCPEKRRETRTLGRHLERAFRLHRRLRALEGEAAGLGAALDAAEKAVLCLDCAGKVTMANSVARRMLEAGAGLRVSPAGTLQCEYAADTVALRKMLADRCAGRTQGMAAMQVRRRSGEAAPLNLTAMPVDGRLPEGAVAEKAVLGGASMLLFLGDPSRTPRSRAEVMRSLYGLTPSEGRVCDGLLEGLETREVAARMRTTLETARFHMKQILRKTGAGRQSELVRLMMALPTMH